MAHVDAPSTVNSRVLSARHNISQRLRPLSWFSHQKSSAQDRHCPRSVSAQLPKASSTSTVGRSVISAPILTSTTNIEVARTEGVHCGEISDVAFSQSNWDSQVGWVAETSTEKSYTSGHDCHSERPQPNQKNASLGSREFRGGRMFRFGNALKTRLTNSSLSNYNEAALLTQQSPSFVGNSNSQSTSNARPGPQRRAGTLSLYKGKIKGFAWTSHIRRKPVNNSSSIMTPQQDPPLLGELNEVDATRTYSAQEDAGSAFGSLTRSFASAVEKLDFHSPLPRNMTFLRSKSSFFNIKKGTFDNDGHQELNKTDNGISTLARTSSLNKCSASTGVGPSAMVSAQAVNLPTNHILAARKMAPEPMVYSTEHNGYRPSRPVAGHPRGVHPLRMHPPDPVSASTIKPQRAETPSQVSEDGSESISLEDAPIYSPSLGDLSQYARETPPSTKNAKLRKAVVIDTTPTRVFVKENKQGSSLGGSLRKSSSALSLFSKARSVRSAEKRHRHDSQPSALPRTDSVALQQRDVNQKIGIQDEKAVKKSRSLHFGSLFKRESSSTLGSSTPRDRSIAFQPATPSPLRNVTRVRRSQSTAKESPPFGRKGVVQESGTDELVGILKSS